MTNTDIVNIFNSAASDSFAAGLRAVWNAGWYAGKAIVPSAAQPDRSIDAAKPAAYIKAQKK